MPELSWTELIETAKKEGGGYAPLDPGEYDVVITQVDVDRNENKGKDYFSARVRVVDDTGYKKLVWWNIYLSPESAKSMNVFFSQMGILGLDTAFFQSGPSLQQIADGLVGKPFRAVLGVSNYNPDKPRNEVNEVRTPTDAGRANAAKYLSEFPLGSEGSGGNNSGSSSTPATPSNPGVPTPSATPDATATPTPSVPAAARPAVPPVPPRF